MLLFLRNKCFLKLHCAVISRNISRSTTNGFVSSYDLQKTLLKSKQKLTNGMLMQFKGTQSSATDKDELQHLMTLFPDIVKDLTAQENVFVLPNVAKWFTEVMEYNVPTGNKYRPKVLLLTYRMMTKPEHQTPENTRLAMILGWCIEMFLASFLIADDVVDGSEMRRGSPCWYRRDGIGLTAIKDSFLLLGSLYALIRKHFHGKPYYNNILDIFNDVLLQTSVGQSSECYATSPNTLELFTKERYKGIAVHKAAFCTLTLPVDLGMCLTENPSELQHARPILCDMGYFYQVENDFHDCFGDLTTTGKTGSDIQEGACTWLAVTALEKASPVQRKIMEECYGSSDPQKVAAVKSLYNDLDIRNEYETFKNEIFNNIQIKIQKIPSKQQQNLLLTVFEKLKIKLA